MTKQMWTSRTFSVGFVLMSFLYMDFFAGMAEAGNQARTNLQVQVTAKKAGSNQGEPVAGAQVFVKSEVQDEDFDETVSTDSEGVARISNVPRGPVLIQVTKQGFVNAGLRNELTKKDQTIKIVMTAEGGASPSPTPPRAASPSPSPTLLF